MQEKILTLAQAAEQLGVSQRTVTRFVDNNQIKGFKIGSRWKFMQSEVDDYFDRQRNKASDDTQPRVKAVERQS
jgi:excisionase family DNA binding protein